MYKAKRKSDSRQQNIKGSITPLREVKAKLTLWRNPNEGYEGGTTAGKIAIGAQHSNVAATIIATAFVDFSKNGNFRHLGRGGGVKRFS